MSWQQVCTIDDVDEDELEDFEVGGKTYHSMQGRGAGGQFIFMFPELDLVVVVTSNNKGMGTLLRSLPKKLIPAFTGN